MKKNKVVKQNRKYLKSILSYSILIVIGSLFAYYIFKHRSDLLELRFVNPVYIVLLAFMSILGLIVNGFVLKVLVEPFKVNLKKSEAIGLSIITNFYNFITPFHGGAGVRAVYLKTKHDFPYVYFLATLSAIYIIIFFVNCIGGLLSMAMILWFNHMFNWIIFTLFLLFFLFLLGIIIFSPKVPEPKNNFIKKIADVINGWHLIKDNRKVIFYVTIFSIIQLILGSASSMIAYYSFGVHLSFFKAMFMSSIGIISLMISFTPGNLGVGDAINIFVANLVGIGFTQALAANILLRMVGIIVISILGPIFSYYLLRHKVRKDKEKETKKKKR